MKNIVVTVLLLFVGPRASLNTDGPSTSKQPGESNEISERKVNNLVPEIGVRRTRKPSPISMEEKDTP